LQFCIKHITMTSSLPPKHLVLYADDDQDDISLVTDAFSEYANIELKTFPDGIALLNYVRFQPGNVKPCLVMIDINMPKMNGKQVLMELRNTTGYEDVPMVLFSTSTLPSEAAFAASFNAGFVIKPLYYHHLSSVADSLIEHCTDEVKKRIRNFQEK